MQFEHTCRSRLMAARPIMVQRDLAPAWASPSSITSAVNCSAWCHTCMCMHHCFTDSLFLLFCWMLIPSFDVCAKTMQGMPTAMLRIQTFALP